MLERILKFSIDHRWLVVLLTVGAGLVGAVTLRRLPIDAVPDITNNQVTINTVYAALTPVEIEKQVTFPVETSLAGIPGLEYTRSLSRNGFSQVTAVFEDSVDIYFARQQVLERLTEARESLPPGAEPKMGSISTGLGEIYMWAVEYEPRGETPAADGAPGWQSDGSYRTPEGRYLRSDLERAAYLREVQDWIIRPQLKNVVGVAGVDAIGGFEKQYHVQPDPMKLVSYGLTFADVIEALERNNVSAGAGYIEHNGEAYLIRAANRLENETQIAEVVVGERGGVPIRVRDVASVAIGRELRMGSATENGEEVVIGTAQMLIGANSRTVAAAVDERMQAINETLPEGVRARTVLNRTKLVDATIHTVAKNLAEGAVLVIVVLFVLLGNFRAALICALAIPLSMLLTSIGMVQSRVSGNLMSLGAIDFGLIVDGAVIIVENCLRRLAERQHQLGRVLTLRERMQTVFEASKQVRTATAFGEAIIITVYIPILFLTGVEGKMFNPMALTVIFALVAAFVLSLTFIPAMVAIGLGGKIQERENFLIRGAKAAYAPVVRFALWGRYAVVGVAVLAFAASLLLFTRLGQEFAPTLDEQDILLETLRIPSTGITMSTELQREVETVISTFPEVAVVFSKVGTGELASDPMPVNGSDTFIILKPRAEWPDPKEPKLALSRRMEVAASDVPGVRFESTQPIQMRFNELIAGVRSDVAIKVFGEEFEQMTPTADAIASVLQRVRGAQNVKVEQTGGLPVMNITMDRAAAARYGLSAADIQDVLATAIGGREAGLVFEGDRRFELVVRLPDALRDDPAAIARIPIPLRRQEEAAAATAGETQPRAAYVPLGTVANISVVEGPNQISRENGKRRVVVQCNVRDRDIGSFVAEAQLKIREHVKLPAGSFLEWGGQFENLQVAKARLQVVVPICFFLIFLLLFGTFGTVRHALLVFSCVPLGLTGGIIALWARDLPFSISAAVGFIALSGVAVLNGLVMITFINQLRGEGLPLNEAITRGSMTRLRPVLMTALVASLGFVPMAIATGTGAEVQRPLATVVIGGLVSSTLLTLLVLPALYRIFERRGGGPPGVMPGEAHEVIDTNDDNAAGTVPAV
jgi:cobalt-zinc-cadmium resistance protein CzcA